MGIIDDSIRLLDIENYVLGVPSFYRPFFVQHSKIHSAEAIDVYSFGHVLFEMSMGYPLQESVIRQVSDCPESLSKSSLKYNFLLVAKWFAVFNLYLF